MQESAPAWEGAGSLARRRAAYDRRIVPLGDGTWYWHLYLNGERLNGGLSPSRDDARAAAGHAITIHLAGEASSGRAFAR